MFVDHFRAEPAGPRDPPDIKRAGFLKEQRHLVRARGH